MSPSIRYSVDVHYTWVGPPDMSEQKRDIAGPIKLRRKLSNGWTTTYQMYFWCLDEHVDAFQRKFAAQGVSDITVRGMQSFLESCKGTLYRIWYWYGARETDLVSRVEPIIAAAASRNSSVRERVNAKNVWSFFVLYTWGGYHFDTGIEPDPERTLNLEYFKSFKVPATKEAGGLGPFHAKQTGVAGLNGLCSAMPGISKTLDCFSLDADINRLGEVEHIDVWALYSERYDGQAARALHWYCCIWNKLEELRKSDGNNSDNYKAACRSAIIDALYTTLLHDSQGKCLEEIPPTNCWDAGAKIDDGKLRELGLLKKYYGSHH